MMGFFTKSNTLKKTDSFNEDLTLLDPPSLPNDIPKLKLEHEKPNSLQFLTEQNSFLFTNNCKNTSTSPTYSQFSKTTNQQYVVTSATLQGEMERNVILEQQIRLLSQQAALALDKLSEVSKSNDYYKLENEELKSQLTKKQRFSLSNKLNRRQNSISSTSTTKSVFSTTPTQLSAGTSMNSISTLLEPTTMLNELSQSYQKEITQIRTQYETEIDSLKNHISTITRELLSNEDQISSLSLQVTQLESKLKKELSKSQTLISKFNIKQKYYETQLNQLLAQLNDRRERDYLLRQRLNDYSNINFELGSSKKLVV